ncbi:MAG TPA: sigma-70 family RNA polymerase sigma factor [Bacteroidota bacterium]|nr:sigma-70 family RNA polymerase sigma factor [Bacteroidota bacterium]
MEARAEAFIRDTEIGRAAQGERGRLLAFIRRRVSTDSQAEDILQDVFYQLLTSYSVTEPLEQMTGWLFTVARNKIIDWYRRKRPANRSLDEALDGSPVTLSEVLPSPVEGPDAGYDREVIAEELTEALEELPVKQREVFIMHEIEGRSFNEIQEITGAPLNTLLSRKRYAVQFLRTRLEDLYREITD